MTCSWCYIPAILGPTFAFSTSDPSYDSVRRKIFILTTHNIRLQSLTRGATDPSVPMQPKLSDFALQQSHMFSFYDSHISSSVLRSQRDILPCARDSSDGPKLLRCLPSIY
ncbi:hypothetical protein F4677DRAFT_431517 [Hypoxylon crocopeplum]|nr:hypothetical protein F4677DRAFT_431517 [Hypoxylon crocopeplum]